MVDSETRFKTRRQEERVVVAVSGDVDLYSAPGLRSAILAAAIGPSCGLVIDLSQVTFMDSSALGVLVGASKRAQSEGAWMKLICPDDRLLKLFQITGLVKVFDFADTVEAG